MSNTGFTPPPMTAPQSGGGQDFQLIEPGAYPARLVWLIMTGTIESDWQGQKKKKKELLFGYELPTELLPADHPRKGEPSFISKTMTYHMGEQANMRTFINQWRGQALTNEQASAFDISKMIGVPAVLTIVHNSGKKDPSKTYANIGSIQSEASQKKMMPDFVVPPQVNKSIYFSVDWLSTKDGAEYAMPIFNSLPEWVRKKIMESDEWKTYTITPYYIAPVAQPQQANTPAPTPQASQQAQAQPQALTPTPVTPQKAQSQPQPQAPTPAPVAQAQAQPPQTAWEAEEDDGDLPF